MNWSEKTIVFDLDGTLIDTAPDLHAALSYAYSRRNMEHADLSAIRSVIGHGARAMISRSADLTNTELPPSLLDDLHHDFLEYYVRHIVDHSKPFPGITDTLDIALDNGARLAVCTNKTQDLAERSLTEIGLRDKFIAVLGADRASEKKPSANHLKETISLADGNVDHAVMIGDSSTDGLSAKAAGIPFIFMTYGYPDDQMNDLKPFMTLGSAKDLPAAIQKCFS